MCGIGISRSSQVFSFFTLDFHHQLLGESVCKSYLGSIRLPRPYFSSIPGFQPRCSCLRLRIIITVASLSKQRHAPPRAPGPGPFYREKCGGMYSPAVYGLAYMLACSVTLAPPPPPMIRLTASEQQWVVMGLKILRKVLLICRSRAEKAAFLFEQCSPHLYPQPQIAHLRSVTVWFFRSNYC